MAGIAVLAAGLEAEVAEVDADELAFEDDESVGG